MIQNYSKHILMYLIVVVKKVVDLQVVIQL